MRYLWEIGSLSFENTAIWMKYNYCEFWIQLDPLCFNQKVGDLIETYLVQIRDIDKVMKSAKTGSVKERRNAAFELASLAATGDDTKFRIVQEGG